ncbi:MAG: SUMF1/EgtB/PvdO family nonheme iron enzyme [Planctomycetota bacterium]|nr:SUMF1/EgtB/PvdO family nonheme iron enzyme [Planctomycetota bacterium]
MTDTNVEHRVPRVFISSTAEDLPAYRDAAKEAVVAAQMLPRMMEYFTASGDRPPLDKCLAEVSACDLLVLLVAHRYGWIPDDQPAGPGHSITRLEVERAVAAEQEVLAFLVDDKHPWPENHREESGLLAAIRACTATAEQLAEVQQRVERLRQFKTWLNARGIRAAFTTPEHLRRLVSEAVYDWRIRHLPAAAPPPAEPPSPADQTRYLAWLRDQTSYIDIRGLQVGSGRAPRFPIEDLYIPLTTSAAWDAQTEDEPADEPQQRMSAGGRGRIDLRTALRNDRLVIVGDPRAGKTTLLRRIACLACQGLIADEPRLVLEQLGWDQPLFPILIRVADLTAHLAAAQGRPAAPATDAAPGWFPHYLAQASQAADLGLKEAFFRDRLDRGQAVLLLDGLDEAPTEQHRQAIATLLERTTERYGGCRYVLTSRPAAFTGELVLPGFAHVEIDPLEDDAIEIFLRRWCQALFVDNPADAERHLAELLDALRSRGEIRRMARNPVMLTALAVVHWNEKRLPEQRADLYESIITWLSRARMQRPGRSAPERCVGLLQDLALAMQDQADGRQTQVPRHAAAEILAPYWRETPEQDRPASAQRFLAEEELDSGIIVGRGDHVRFWHLTFQEYLAARALAARSEAEQRSVLLAQPKLYAAEWKEVVLLLAGVLYHQGLKRVDGMLSAVLDQLGRRPSLADQALCVGLLGAAVRDLGPVNYAPGDSRYRQLLTDVLQIFEPDWLSQAQRRHGGLWSRLAGVVAPQLSQTPLMRLAIQAADVLGQAGLPQYAPAMWDQSWVTIPAGTFLMGAQSAESLKPSYDAEASANESPVHEVHLDAFQIARYPVTVGQYQRFVAADGYQCQRWWSGGGFGQSSEPGSWEDQQQYPARPVVEVSWYEAAAYAAWAGARLPTEAEWERAARGTEGRRWPWGNENPDETRMNYWRVKPNVGSPTPVGIYPRGATSEGICDLSGNVWEWCADRHADDYYRTSPRENPTGPSAGSFRVLRGGSWFYCARYCRPASRCDLVPGSRFNFVGLRLVRGCVGCFPVVLE